MRRRRFMSLTAATAALSTLGLSCSGSASRGAAALVDTPEKRRAYLADLLQRICVDIGPHSVFDPAYDQVAALVKAEMEKGMQAEYSRCTFKGWRLLSEARFEINGKRVEAFACHGSPGTPEKGVEGRLVRIEHKNPDRVFYAIEGKDGVLAYALVNDNGGAVPLPVFMNPLEGGPLQGDATFDKEGRWPTLCVGAQDRDLLEKRSAEKATATWSAQSEFAPGMGANTVVGTVAGMSQDELVFLAHLDTVYGSPGANDNTASVIAMLMIGLALSGTRPRHTLRFVATAGEEYGKLGARHYANERRRAGTLGSIKAVVEFDSLTWGNDFWLYSADLRLRNLAEQSSFASGVRGTPKHFNENGKLDVTPFVEAGIPALYVNTRGEAYNPVRKVWHRPEDTPDRVPVELVENGFLAFLEFSKRFTIGRNS